MKPFRVYRVNSNKYLAVTPTHGLRIEGKKLGTTLYRLRGATEVKSTVAKLIIEEPRRDLEAVFDRNLRDARDHWRNYGMTRNKDFRAAFYKSVLSCCSHFDPVALRRPTLRDIAARLGLRCSKTYYRVLYLEARRQLIGRERAVQRAADVTVLKAIQSIREYWPQLFGFSAPLDSMLKAELNIYVTTMRSRGLTGRIG
jgi:hypothetical protein